MCDKRKEARGLERQKCLLRDGESCAQNFRYRSVLRDDKDWDLALGEDRQFPRTKQPNICGPHIKAWIQYRSALDFPIIIMLWVLLEPLEKRKDVIFPLHLIFPPLFSPKKWGVGIRCCDPLLYQSNHSQENMGKHLEVHRKDSCPECQTIQALRFLLSPIDLQGLPIPHQLNEKNPELMGHVLFYHLHIGNAQ